MKKRIFSIVCALVVSAASLSGLVSCKKKGVKGMITADPLTKAELGESFNEKYLPDTDSIRALTGSIDVCLDFEGTQDGWKALAKEYERLQGGGVKVNIDVTVAGSSYSDKLNSELQKAETTWDIVEGNLGYGNTDDRCVDMYSNIAAVNPYCGKDVRWEEVLKPEAYRTKEADTSKKSIIMNTEIMQTCWFINDVAFQAAVEHGYLNADDEAEYPITWQDLINLCVKMEESGYTNPLGITLCDASIESLQFTWLLRVYGDYYYRQFYQYIQGGAAGTIWENYDPRATVPEKLAGYNHKYSKIFGMLFNKEYAYEPYYVGFVSDIYRDFVGQLAKMKGHLIHNPTTTEFGQLRDQFETQSKGMESPQIMLDYQGFGINYEKAKKDNFSVGYFDYPTMVSQYVPSETITRDIGGNGGFISIVRHDGDSAQTELSKDFIKFVLSPYGQTIYYKGLAKANKVPKGLSTVNNDLVVIPQEWTSFFNESNKTIKFSGDVDANVFLSWGVRFTQGETRVQEIICENWRKLLISDLTVGAFAAQWATAVEQDAKTLATKSMWPEDVWKNPNYDL